MIVTKHVAPCTMAIVNEYIVHTTDSELCTVVEKAKVAMNANKKLIIFVYRNIKDLLLE